MRRKKYFQYKCEAVEALKQYDPRGWYGLHIFKMPKGSRKAGWYVVCSEIEYLNTK